jgi:4-hydroxybenzoate polyprenyltransferase
VAVATPAATVPDPSLLALFATGAFIMRGAGCTINDLWDQDVDRQVTRTMDRPLASGQVTVSNATAFLAGQLLAGLLVLVSLPHPQYCFGWGLASLPLVAVYPATKRFFRYPQLILGLTINWGAIMGWAAVHGSMDPSVIVPLYTSGVTWTLLYDTFYAHQDKRDDRALGLHSTALSFGENQKRTLYGLAAITALQWSVVGYQADLAVIPYGLGVTVAAGHLLWQVNTANLDDPINLATRFRSNATVGGIMFAALVAGKYFA